MNEGVRVAEEVLRGMPRPPEIDAAENAVPRQVLEAQGGGMIGAMLGTAGDDIGRTACRQAEDVSGAMPRPPEEKGHLGDGEIFS